ncbi:MAG: signal peptidase I [Ruminococcaceae bacterium]|nr:signal peptidase I [Oscillospiraceae bacterium]
MKKRDEKLEKQDKKTDAVCEQELHEGDDLPSARLISEELKRERNKIRYRRILKSTLYALVIVAAVAVLIATLILPVLQISGTSMEPTLSNGDIVVLVKTSKLDRGDLCGFSYSNKILIKRVIGLPGDSIVIDENGTVFVNGKELSEPYISEKGLGECDIEFPFTVPENEYFLMGDHRLTSIDSRSTVIGCVEREQIVGKLLLKVWPLSELSTID